jgi:dTDP-glucose pyrophosphorylase
MQSLLSPDPRRRNLLRNLIKALEQSTELREGARLFDNHVHDPARYSIVEFDAAGRALPLEETPKESRMRKRS